MPSFRQFIGFLNLILFVTSVPLPLWSSETQWQHRLKPGTNWKKIGKVQKVQLKNQSMI